MYASSSDTIGVSFPHCLDQLNPNPFVQSSNIMILPSNLPTNFFGQSQHWCFYVCWTNILRNDKAAISHPQKRLNCLRSTKKPSFRKKLRLLVLRLSFTELLPTPDLSMLLSYPHPIVRSKLPTPRNTQLHTQIHNRSPKSRPGRQTTMTMKSAFLLNWTINCLRNSCLWVGALPGTFDIHTLPGTTSIRKTVWVHVRKNALLNHVVFLIKTNLTHSIFSTVHSNRTSSFLKSSPKILRTVCYATFYF